EKKGDPLSTVVMDYFDGNTVTAYWNYAQNFAMNDNSFGSTPGPSTPGAIEVVSGQTHGATSAQPIPGTLEQGSVISDADPEGDRDSAEPTFTMNGQNIGDLLNANSVTWGWFEGGFLVDGQFNIGADGKPKTDYVPHHQPFQYYATTRNPKHVPPSSVAAIGKSDPPGTSAANHQYDLIHFWQAL